MNARFIITRARWILVLVALALAGCGESSQFDPATQYTAESLAQELSFRYRTLKPAARAASAKPAPLRKDRDAEVKSLAEEATKKAPAATLDELLAEIADKATLIPGKSRPEVCKAMIDSLAQDKELNDSDKQLLSDKLQQLGQGS
ncbi:MAG: hypothetical protein P4L84_04040 [Isosphaeraceae bacterium]|nr:hypothetical protein [Isosphaeraceae bacterium]